MNVDNLLKIAQAFITKNESLYRHELNRTSPKNSLKVKEAGDLYKKLSLEGNRLLKRSDSMKIREITWACQLLSTIAFGRQFYKSIELVKPVAVEKNGVDYVLAMRINEYLMRSAFDRRDSQLERVFDVLHIGHSFDNKCKWIYQSTDSVIVKMINQYRGGNIYKTIAWNGFEINEEGNFFARVLPGIPEHKGNSLSIIIQRHKDEKGRIPATIPFYAGTAKEITLDAAGLERQIRDAVDYIKTTVN
ncbi:hypothetical protein JXA85_08320 [Candidatus Woesearchaeota archaeon]|nr:hypothetical protein [Candidatus Woesearchaeota archaeon]